MVREDLRDLVEILDRQPPSALEEPAAGPEQRSLPALGRAPLQGPSDLVQGAIDHALDVEAVAHDAGMWQCRPDCIAVGLVHVDAHLTDRFPGGFGQILQVAL